MNGISGAEGVLRNAVDAAALHIAVYKGSEPHLTVCIGLAGSHVGHNLQHRAHGNQVGGDLVLSNHGGHLRGLQVAVTAADDLFRHTLVGKVLQPQTHAHAVDYGVDLRQVSGMAGFQKPLLQISQ